jgi:hypothetical protein
MKCPAEESANLEKLQPINARRSSERIDTRISDNPLGAAGGLCRGSIRTKAAYFE